MNAVWKCFLSMSFSGGLLILILLLGKRFLKDSVSRQWQYYIWMVVILRLLLPFGPDVNLLGKPYQAVDRAISQAITPLPQQLIQNTSGDTLAPAVDWEQKDENATSPAEDFTTAHPLQDIGMLLINHVWLVWLVAALGLFIRKITGYQNFMRYIQAGLIPVSDLETLDRLSIAAEQAGVQKPVELCINPLISSPLLIGFFHPCIVLPRLDLSEKNFQYIVLHELTHYRRRDIFYKWLVQITVCLHWFNPLVHLMSWEMTRACEFSCDEAVLARTGGDNARDYGKTLLDAMAAVGSYKENLVTVTLSENKQLLKERLGAIMHFQKKSTAIRFLTGILTLCVVLGATFVGVYPVAAAAQDTTENLQTTAGKTPAQWSTGRDRKVYASQAARYYEAGSLPLFQIIFPRLDEETQDKWLDRIYTENQIAFWGVAVGFLEEDCDLVQRYAEKTYANDGIAYFSTLAMHMSKDMLDKWLDKALDDGKWAFQSVLFRVLDQEDALDEREEQWLEAWKAEYRAAGITIDGKNCYYQGQLVNIFLDIRSKQGAYTLNMNPKGSVNIRIIRDADQKITGVAYMTEAEVAELLYDMRSDDDTGEQQ